MLSFLRNNDGKNVSMEIAKKKTYETNNDGILRTV
jgi:hypothetical protein